MYNDHHACPKYFEKKNEEVINIINFDGELFFVFKNSKAKGWISPQPFLAKKKQHRMTGVNISSTK